ncbi:MAG: redoxin family protein [Actinobacteria bacterium]|nr:redoxin family protein [Actinomycetota bacterium]
MTDQPTETRRRGVGFWVIVGGAGLLVIATAWVMFLRTDPGSYDPREPRNIPLAGEQMADLELPLLDGSGTVALADLRGEVLVINFFASYCIPCRAEHAELTALSDAYGDRGVQFVGIVYQDTTAAITGFLDQYGWGDGYLYLQDPGSRAVVEFGVYGVPETYVVDADGVIVHKEYGAIVAGDLMPVLDELVAG